VSIKSTSREEIICTNMTKTTICITKIMERDNSGSMRRNSLGENPSSISEALTPSISKINFYRSRGDLKKFDQCP